MPVFHTKTIESILDPVAQQVSQLVILHEEGEDGKAMPDLLRPVLAVSAAVQNLVRVGQDTADTTHDKVLKEHIPAPLQQVDIAAHLLTDAATMLKEDPYSSAARKKLIDGARGILSGTSSLLLVFDEAEVRKIIRICKSVLEYLAIAEVVESIEDLAVFVKNLTPGMTNMAKLIDTREKELTHQQHRDLLVSSMSDIKNLTPVLMSSIKMFVQTKQTSGYGLHEAIQNRNYVVKKMCEDIHEIIRVLQLTTSDETGWDEGDLNLMKKTNALMSSRLDQANNWLSNPAAEVGGMGELTCRQVIDDAAKVGQLSMEPFRSQILGDCDDLIRMIDDMLDMKRKGLGNTPQCQQLTKEIQDRMYKLHGLVDHSISTQAANGMARPAPVMSGKVEQAQKWLRAPWLNDRGLGQQALRLAIAEGRRIADTRSGPRRGELVKQCEQLESLTNQLADLVARGMGQSPQAQALAARLSDKLNRLHEAIQMTLVDQVAEDFIDTTTPVKQLASAANAPINAPNRDSDFNSKGAYFEQHANRLASTAERVANSGGCNDRKTIDDITSTSSKIRDLTPQVISSARIVLQNPDNPAAKEHFELLKREWISNIDKLTALVDAAIDTQSFVTASEEAIKKDSAICDVAINSQKTQDLVTGASNIARRANRVLMVANQEVENSEDPKYCQTLNVASSELASTISPMVLSAKDVASNSQDTKAQGHFYDNNHRLINAVGLVRQAVTVSPPEEYFPPPPPPPPVSDDLPDVGKLRLDKQGYLPQQFEEAEQMMRSALDYRDTSETVPPCIPPPPPPVPPLPHTAVPSSDTATSVHIQSERVTPFSTDRQLFSAPVIPPPPHPQSPSLPAPPEPVNRHVYESHLTHIHPYQSPWQLQHDHPLHNPTPPADGLHKDYPVPPPPVPPQPLYYGGTDETKAQLSPQEFDSGGGVADDVFHTMDESPLVWEYPGVDYNPERAPPRPPLPLSSVPPSRPPVPGREFIDDDSKEVFFPVPKCDEPILVAAHNLHMEAQKWQSEGNDLIAAAKKMALLMAEMSRLVRGEGGSKKDLIDCAKRIAKESEEVTKLSKEVARKCTDKRMRTTLLQVCEKIPTVATQLKILSTVKATMLGSHVLGPDGEVDPEGTKEDIEATEMLIGNAQNLMHAVKDTVRSAEAASIKIRTDSGHMMRWARKLPWYMA